MTHNTKNLIILPSDLQVKHSFENILKNKEDGLIWSVDFELLFFRFIENWLTFLALQILRVVQWI